MREVTVIGTFTSRILAPLAFAVDASCSTVHVPPRKYRDRPFASVVLPLDSHDPEPESIAKHVRP